MNKYVIGIIILALLILVAYYANQYARTHRVQPAPTTSQSISTDKPCPQTNIIEGDGFTIGCSAGDFINITSGTGTGGMYLQSISISAEEGGHWVMVIQVYPTDKTSTEAWIASQPNLADTHPGIKLLQWADAGPYKLVVYLQDIGVDTDANGNTIYHPEVHASYVTNGRLYTAIGGSDDYNDPKPTQDFLSWIKTFRLTK